MKNLINIIILAIISFSMIDAANAQTTAAREIRRGDILRNRGQISAAVMAYNNAKRIAHQNTDWRSMLSLSSRYLSVKQEWAAQNAFGLAFTYSYDMAIGDPNKTGIRRDCSDGRSGLGSVIRTWNRVLNPMPKSSGTANNMFFNAKQASNARNWLNYHHGSGCPPTQAKPVINTSKSRYKASDNIVVTFGGLPGNNNDLITVVDSSNRLVRYYYTGGDRKGGVRFRPLPAGTYEARVRFAAGRIEAWKRFSVVNNPTPPPTSPGANISVMTKKLVYSPAEKIVVKYSGMPGNSGYWIGIFKPGSDSSIDYAYTRNYRNGEMTFDELEPGKYEVHVVESKSGDSVASHAFAVRKAAKCEGILCPQ